MSAISQRFLQGKKEERDLGQSVGDSPSSVALMMENKECEPQQGAGEGRKEYGSPGTVIGNQQGYQ